MMEMRKLDSRRTGGTKAAPGAGDWRLFHHNAEIWPAVIAECEAAQESLTLEQFIFSPNGIGRRLLDVLTGRAKAGVHVRVLADGFGSRHLANSEGGRALRAAGGELVLYDTLRDVLRNPVRRLSRLHRKTVIRDRQSAIIGGACYHDRMSDWRDTMIRIEGEVVDVAADVFDALWNRQREEHEREAPAHSPPGQTRNDWAYMISTPVKPAERELYHTLLSRIADAERHVTLTTPYLVPDLRFMREIARLAKRDVQVRIVLPAKSDHPTLDVIGRRFAHALARRGAEIWCYEPSMIHCKLALVDGTWASVTSFNLDILSFWLNLESGVVGTEDGFCEAVAEQLERDIAASSPL